MINKYLHSCDSSGPVAKRRLIKPPLKSIHPCRCSKEAIIIILNDDMHLVKVAEIFLPFLFAWGEETQLSLWFRDALLQGTIRASAARPSATDSLCPLPYSPSCHLNTHPSSFSSPPWLLITIKMYGSCL